MSNPMRVWTTGELYPPQKSIELSRFLDWIVARIEDGRHVLKREMSHGERAGLEARKAIIAKWFAKPRQGEIQTIVLALITGFGNKSTTMEEAAIQATQYAYALRELPLWAIKRACDRFASGSVTPDEVGAKFIDRAHPPSTAQISIVARAFYSPLSRDHAVITEVLRGIPDKSNDPVTEDERAAQRASVDAMLAEVKKSMSMSNLGEREEEVRRANILADMKKKNLAARRREYVGAGLEPPASGPDGLITSLPMMLKEGWTIQGPPGERVLVPPARESVPARETQPHEMGS